MRLYEVLDCFSPSWQETMIPKPFPAAFHEGIFVFPTLRELDKVAHAAEGYPAAHSLIPPDPSMPWFPHNKVEILPCCASRLGSSKSEHT